MNDRINALLAETHNELREQLSAAQRHFHRLEELLASRESKDISALNRAMRRLRGSRNREWSQVVNDAASAFAARAALFTVRNGSVELDASRGRMPLEAVPLTSAPAFQSAVDTQDTVVAVRTRGEMSAPIADYFGESSEERFHLFPVSSGGRVVALVYADGPRNVLQPDALELLATIAGAILEGRPAEAQNGLVNIAGSLVAVERDVDLKAQRFARVLVAEIVLYQDEQVKSGRAARDLYASLRPQIDEAREAYRASFLTNSESLPDYLHHELVTTLANGDVEVLGQDYPGPLA
jgi:hypothetical protein